MQPLCKPLAVPLIDQEPFPRPEQAPIRGRLQRRSRAHPRTAIRAATAGPARFHGCSRPDDAARVGSRRLADGQTAVDATPISGVSWIDAERFNTIDCLQDLVDLGLVAMRSRIALSGRR
jgi:hypothetical protein